MATKLKGREFVMLTERDSMMIPVCCGRDLEITISSEIIEATKAPQSSWKNWLYGVKSYSVTTSGLVIIDDSFGINDFYNAMNNKQTLAFVTQSNQAHDVFFSGNILITDITMTGSYKDVMTYSIQATGDGALSNLNPYEFNITVDEDGNAVTDEDGNIIYDQESGDLLPIDLDINC
jgi:predicted secreted protein